MVLRIVLDFLTVAVILYEAQGTVSAVGLTQHLWAADKNQSETMSAEVNKSHNKNNLD